MKEREKGEKLPIDSTIKLTQHTTHVPQTPFPLAPIPAFFLLPCPIFETAFHSIPYQLCTIWASMIYHRVWLINRTSAADRCIFQESMTDDLHGLEFKPACSPGKNFDTDYGSTEAMQANLTRNTRSRSQRRVTWLNKLQGCPQCNQALPLKHVTSPYAWAFGCRMSLESKSHEIEISLKRRPYDRLWVTPLSSIRHMGAAIPDFLKCIV